MIKISKWKISFAILLATFFIFVLFLVFGHKSSTPFSSNNDNFSSDQVVKSKVVYPSKTDSSTPSTPSTPTQPPTETILWNEYRKFGTCDILFKEVLNWKDLTLHYYLGQWEISKSTSCSHCCPNMKALDRKEGLNDLFELLKFWSEFTEYHNLDTYTLVAGSVIGYCRGHEPLPWDDDFDIVMAKKHQRFFEDFYDQATPVKGVAKYRSFEFQGEEYLIQGDVKPSGIGWWQIFLRERVQKRNGKNKIVRKPCSGYLDVTFCNEKKRNHCSAEFSKFGNQLYSPHSETSSLDFPKMDFCGAQVRFPKVLLTEKEKEEKEACKKVVGQFYGDKNVPSLLGGKQKSVRAKNFSPPKVNKKNMEYVKKYLTKEEKEYLNKRLNG